MASAPQPQRWQRAAQWEPQGTVLLLQQTSEHWTFFPNTPLFRKGAARLRWQAGHVSPSTKFSQQNLNEGDKNTSQHLALTLHSASSETWTALNLISSVSVFLRAVLSSPSRRSCWPTSMLNHQPGSYSQPLYRKPASPRTRNTLFIGSPPLEAERNSNITAKTCSAVFWKRHAA